MATLGKGLESLIPQKGSASKQAPANSRALPAEPPLPPHDTEPELPPAEGGARLLRPVAPEEFDLPHSHEQIMSAIPPAAISGFTVPPTILFSHVPSERPQSLPPSPRAAEPKQKKNDSAPQEYIFHLEVEKITPNPTQPRRDFNEAAIRDLANSIREFGIIQPIIVSKISKETPTGLEVEYQLIAGERRLLAAKLLGLRVVPAIIRNIDLEREKLELAVIENLQRENLNPLEMARAFERLQEEFRMTQREIAAKLGKSRETVANTMRLLDLPDYIQDALQKGNLSESHARLLLAVDDLQAQRHIFDDIVEHGLTTRDVKERVKQFGGRAGHRGRPSFAELEANLPPEMRALQNELSSSLGAPVQIQKGATNGKIMITFYSEEELENILRKLGN